MNLRIAASWSLTDSHFLFSPAQDEPDDAAHDEQDYRP